MSDRIYLSSLIVGLALCGSACIEINDGNFWVAIIQLLIALKLGVLCIVSDHINRQENKERTDVLDDI